MASKSHYDHVREYVSEWGPIWRHRMGLGHVEIEHVFLETNDPDQPPGTDHHITAFTDGRWEYLSARIVWYLPSAVRHSDDELAGVLVHELCHVLLMSEQAYVPNKNHEGLELATELCSRAVMAGWKEHR